MTLRTLKWVAVLMPPAIIGSFEFIRHDILMHVLSMEVGNFYMVMLSLVVSYLVASWLFGRIDRTNRRLAEEQARRAVYEERERLAQELHDNIAQILFYLTVNLTKGKVEEARSAVSEIDNHLRQAIFNLRTPPGEAMLFQARVSAWLKEWSAMTGIAVESNLDVEEGSFSPPQELQLFGIVQEAFTNIRKHARATSASLQLMREGGAWTLTVRDNGRGIEAESAASTGYGLTLLSKRAGELGARLEVRSQSGEGTEIAITGIGGGKG